MTCVFSPGHLNSGIQVKSILPFPSVFHPWLNTPVRFYLNRNLICTFPLRIPAGQANCIYMSVYTYRLPRPLTPPGAATGWGRPVPPSSPSPTLVAPENFIFGHRRSPEVIGGHLPQVIPARRPRRVARLSDVPVAQLSAFKPQLQRDPMGLPVSNRNLVKKR